MAKLFNYVCIIVIIISTISLTTSTVDGFNNSQKQEYRATQKVIIVSARDDLFQSDALSFLMQGFVEYLNTDQITQAVIDNIEIDMQPDEILSITKFDVNFATQTIQITVVSTNPNQAATIARAWGTQLVEFREHENSNLRDRDRIFAYLVGDAMIVENNDYSQVTIQPQSYGATACFYRAPWEDRFYTDINNIGNLIEKPDNICSDISTLVLEEGDLLVFKLTVRNNGHTPILTTGSFPGTVYQFDQQFDSFDHLENGEAWQVGINCQGDHRDFPWRWRLGLENLADVNNNPVYQDTFHYLEENTQQWENPSVRNCWAGLIHKDMTDSSSQLTVGHRSIQIVSVD